MNMHTQSHAVGQYHSPTCIRCRQLFIWSACTYTYSVHMYVCTRHWIVHSHCRHCSKQWTSSVSFHPGGPQQHCQRHFAVPVHAEQWEQCTYCVSHFIRIIHTPVTSSVKWDYTHHNHVCTYVSMHIRTYVCTYKLSVHIILVRT